MRRWYAFSDTFLDSSAKTIHKLSSRNDTIVSAIRQSNDSCNVLDDGVLCSGYKVQTVLNALFKMDYLSIKICANSGYVKWLSVQTKFYETNENFEDPLSATLTKHDAR